MPQISKVMRLSKEDREWLDAELIKRGFGGYEVMESLCHERGIDISSSSLHRHGQGLRDRLERIRVVTEQARAVVAESPDDEGAVNEALMRLVQEQLFDLLTKAQLDADGMTLPQIARAIADLGRASISQKRLAADARERVLKEQREKIESLSGQDGVDAETLRRVIQAAYGL